MPLLSMNPRVSAHFSPALSDNTIAVLRPLLRSIAMWHRERTRLMPLDPDLEFDDIDVDEVPEPDTPSRNEFKRALNAPYEAKPAASFMPQIEVEAAIAAGRDPWAEGASSDLTSYLQQPPIATMLVAARFAALLSNATTLSTVTAPRAFAHRATGLAAPTESCRPERLLLQ